MTTGGGAADSTWGKGCFGTLVMDGAITGRWLERPKAQRFAMQVVELLNKTENFYHIGNVQWFRMSAGGLPNTIMGAFVPYGGEKNLAVTCWDLTIPVELIFNTYTEYGT